MGSKVRRVRVTLDPQGITELSGEEIRIILRGADELIFSGGRSWFMANAAGRLNGKPTPTNFSGDSTGSLLIAMPMHSRTRVG